MYRQKLKKQIKDELMRDERAYEIFDELIEIFIDFDDKLYERAMKKRYDEEPKGRTEIYSRQLTSSYSRESSFERRRHVDEHVDIVSMKLNFTIRPNKGRKPQGKKNDMKRKKTCYSYGKSSHFVKDCRTREMMLSRQINATLKKILDEWKTQNIDSNNSNIASIITNDEYFKIKNSKKLQQVLNEEIISTTFASNQEINNIIKKAYNKTSYFVEKKSHSNEKYEYDNNEMINDLRKLAKKVEKTTIEIKNNAIEIVDTLEASISSDATKDKEISLFLRFKLQRQNVTIEENQFVQECEEYWKNCQNKQCRIHQKLWRQWLNIQRQNCNDQKKLKQFNKLIIKSRKSIQIRINNMSLAKQRKEKAPQWKTHCKSATILKEPYNKSTQLITHVPFARQYDLNFIDLLRW